jgi:hypothetical protein
LHDAEIVGVAQRGVVRVTEYYGLADLLQELRWFLDVGLLPRTRNGPGWFAVSDAQVRQDAIGRPQ